MHRIVLLFILLICTACTTGPYPVSSPYYLIPEGSRLLLKQAVTIPPNTGRVFIQYGKVVDSRSKDQYYPHCWFLSWNISTRPTVIEPDTFTIVRTRKLEDYVNRQNPLLFASRNSPLTTGMSGGGATAIEYTTELTIHSAKQPDIRRFACSHWENPTDARHLSLADIHKVMGEIAEIQLIDRP